MQHAPRKVMATPRPSVGPFTRGNGRNNRAPMANLPYSYAARMYGSTPSTTPPAYVLDAIANGVINGTSRASTKQTRQGKVCPACGLTRSVAGLCDCNS